MELVTTTATLVLMLTLVALMLLLPAHGVMARRPDGSGGGNGGAGPMADLLLMSSARMVLALAGTLGRLGWMWLLVAVPGECFEINRGFGTLKMAGSGLKRRVIRAFFPSYLSKRKYCGPYLSKILSN